MDRLTQMELRNRLESEVKLNRSVVCVCELDIDILVSEGFLQVSGLLLKKTAWLSI